MIAAADGLAHLGVERTDYAGTFYSPLAFPGLAAHLLGTRLEAAVVQSMAQDAAVELDPGSDLHASAGYRKHLAAVLSARTLRAAYEQARSKH